MRGTLFATVTGWDFATSEKGEPLAAAEKEKTVVSVPAFKSTDVMVVTYCAKELRDKAAYFSKSGISMTFSGIDGESKDECPSVRISYLDDGGTGAEKLRLFLQDAIDNEKVSGLGAALDEGEAMIMVNTFGLSRSALTPLR